MRFIKYEPGENPNPGTIVTVVCDDEAHEGRVVQLETLFRGADSVWAVFPVRSVKYKDGAMRWARNYLDGDRPLSADEQKAMTTSYNLRERFDLRCPLCDDSLPVRRENLTPVLDVLARHADAWEIELTALRARLLK